MEAPPQPPTIAPADENGTPPPAPPPLPADEVHPPDVHGDQPASQDVEPTDVDNLQIVDDDAAHDDGGEGLEPQPSESPDDSESVDIERSR
jgi:hypothetical protein